MECEMRVACAIMSFNRPAYLEPVLASIAKSFAAASGKIDVHLFQDGPRNPRSGIVRAESHEIDASVRVFQRIFPVGAVRASPENLGVALNFDRAERHLFIEEDYDVVLFFEDDMAVDERYAPFLLGLCDAYGRDHRVGSIACYGESHLATEVAQIARRNELTTLSQAWGFALTRRAYWQRKPWVDRYVNVIRNVDYFQKETIRKAIQDLQATMGFPPHVISQDMFKLMASHAAGLVNLNTVPVLARYIGETGVHNTPAAFKARRFTDTIVYPADAPAPQLPLMTAGLHAELMDKQYRFILASSGARQRTGAAAQA
jgi:hypothetical protein